MSQPPSERDRGGDEDLFEDLDQFFAPLEDSDWAGDEQPSGRAEAPEPGGPVEPASLDDLDALAIDIPDEDELLGAPPGAPSPSSQEAPADAPVSEEEAFIAAQEADEAGTAGSAPAPPTEEELAEWDTLRASAADDEATRGGTVDTEGEPLSLEDLKAAPPEYAHLPGPDEEAAAEAEPPPAAPMEEPVLAQEATIDSLADLEGIQETVASSGGEVPDQGFTTDRIQVPPLEEEAEFAAPEGDEAAQPADIEAAADHFATGMRESPAAVEEDLLADLEQPSPQTVRIDPASRVDQAPAWEEVGAPAEAEPEPAPGEAPPAGPAQRNLTAAFASGLLLAAAVVALLAIGRGPFVVLAVAVILLGQAELYAVLRSRGHRPATLLGLVAGALITAGGYLRGEGALLLGLFIAMATTVLWYMAAPPERRKGLVSGAGATLLGVVYVPFLGAFALLLLRPDRYGTTLFLTVVGLTILYDVLAFGIGSWFGNRPLAPSISPSKSWEGAIGATLGVLLAGIAIVPSLDPFRRPATAVGLALVISALAPIGDLIESALKRELRVKDMSGLLPGHGGILDRIDALLITSPAAYYFLQIFL